MQIEKIIILGFTMDKKWTDIFFLLTKVTGYVIIHIHNLLPFLMEEVQMKIEDMDMPKQAFAFAAIHMLSNRL